jgi:hypothetical protein
MAEDKNRWQRTVNEVMKLQVPLNVGEILD